MAKRIPGWEWVDLGPDGGTFDEMAHPKGCTHTTEGTSLAGAEAAYRDYPPHLGYDPNRRIKHQYVSLDRYSYAFRGSESDDEYVIQVEIVGFAAQTHLWPESAYRNFAEDVLKPLEDMVGIPRRHLRYYRQNEGIVLATATSPVRLSAAALRTYSGWLGHQHIPTPDVHWDPGGFLMDKAFSFIGGAKKEDPMMVIAREKSRPEVWIGDYISRRWVSAEELRHLEDRFGATQVWNDGTIQVLGDETAESKTRRTAAGGPIPGE